MNFWGIPISITVKFRGEFREDGELNGRREWESLLVPTPSMNIPIHIWKALDKASIRTLKKKFTFNNGRKSVERDHSFKIEKKFVASVNQNSQPTFLFYNFKLDIYFSWKVVVLLQINILRGLRF